MSTYHHEHKVAPVPTNVPWRAWRLNTAHFILQHWMGMNVHVLIGWGSGLDGIKE